MALDGEVLTDEEVHRDRALRGHESRRNRKPSALMQLPENASGHDRNVLPVVQEGMKILDPKLESFEERSARLRDARVKYAPMQAHMEMAAIVLAAGGTFRLAAARAGISVRQVKKYYTDPDFRSRIEELRNTVFSKIKGRLLKELERRTKPGSIEQIELLDLLRVFDRVMGPVGGKAGVNIAGDVNVTQQNADTIIAALLAPESGSEEPNFPIYEPGKFSLSDQDPPE